MPDDVTLDEDTSWYRDTFAARVEHAITREKCPPWAIGWLTDANQPGVALGRWVWMANDEAIIAAAKAVGIYPRPTSRADEKKGLHGWELVRQLGELSKANR